MLKVNCPTCGVRLTASDDHIGRPVTCQKCGTKFVLSKRWTTEPLSEDELEQQRQAALNQAALNQAALNQVPPPSPVQTATSSAATANKIGSTVPAAVTIPQPEAGPDYTPATTDPIDSSSETGQAYSEFSQDKEQLQAISRAKTAERRGLPTFDGYTEARSFSEFFDFRFRRYVTPSILKIGWLIILVAAVVWFSIATYTYIAALFIDSQPPDPNAPGMATGMIEPVSAVFLTFVYASTVGAIVVSLLATRIVFESIMALFSICNTLRTINLKDQAKE